jgi:hypothetical protein
MLIGIRDSTRSGLPVHRVGRHLRSIPGAGGDRLLQLGQPGQMTLDRAVADQEELGLGDGEAYHEDRDQCGAARAIVEESAAAITY